MSSEYFKTLLTNNSTVSASAYAISSPVGCLLGGLTLDLWGRRKMNLIGNFGMVVGWLLITFAQNPAMIIYGRITEGCSRGLLATCITVITQTFFQ
jgi:MFS family permease